jgi:hypothetical protein
MTARSRFLVLGVPRRQEAEATPRWVAGLQRRLSLSKVKKVKKSKQTKRWRIFAALVRQRYNLSTCQTRAVSGAEKSHLCGARYKLFACCCERGSIFPERLTSCSRRTRRPLSKHMGPGATHTQKNQPETSAAQIGADAYET